MIINMKETLYEVDANFYNGGWIKKLDGIDESKANGYKYRGEFVQHSAIEGLYEYDEGIYIVCSVEGSRKNQVLNVWLVRITDNAIAFLNKEPFEGNDWALKLLPFAKKVLMVEEESNQNPLVNFSDEQLIDELKRRGVEVTGLKQTI